MKGQVESIAVYNSNLSPIVTAKSIYRYKVKEVQLVDENQTDDVLTFITDFKYFYTDEEYKIDRVHLTLYDEDLQYYFPSLTFEGNFCKAFAKNVVLRIILDKTDKVYRPKYSIRNDVLTLEHYIFHNLFYSSLMSQKCYKEEYDYDKSDKAYTEILNKIALNPDKEEEIIKEAKKKYETVAVVAYNKRVLNTNILTVDVKFHS